MKMLLLAILVILLILIAMPAEAQVEVRFLGGPEIELSALPVPAPTPDCRIGNLRAPGGLLPDTARDVLALAVDADAGVCGCSDGWTAIEVHLLVMNETDHAIGFWLLLAVDEEGIPYLPEKDDCPLPKPGYYGDLGSTSGYVTLPFPGVYELVFEFSGPCAFFDYAYFIKVSPYVGEGLRLVMDGEPRPCTLFHGYNIAERWFWYDYSGFGSPLWWLEAECCSPAIPVEAGTWGALKATYR